MDLEAYLNIEGLTCLNIVVVVVFVFGIRTRNVCCSGWMCVCVWIVYWYHGLPHDMNHMTEEWQESTKRKSHIAHYTLY